MTATVLTLFDVDDTPAPGGGRGRCCRPAKTRGDAPCMAWPARDAPACPHHILAEELAVVEALRRPRAVA